MFCGRPRISLASVERYLNRAGNSGVLSFELQPDAILVRFVGKEGAYLYDSRRPGAEHVRRMKQLAKRGRGLATYISRHVRENYAEHFPRTDRVR